MKQHRPWWQSRAVSVFLAGGAMMMCSGCGSILVPKYKVMVDALADAEKVQAAAAAGKSYKLVVNKNLLAQTTAEVGVIRACVVAAVSVKGMFEAPNATPPDLFIEVSFGTGLSPQGDPSVKEVFLQLSGRTNSTHSREMSQDDEIWNVRAAIDGVSGRLEDAMPLLSTVIAEHMGVDTLMERKYEIPRKSPAIEATRQLATRHIEEVRDRYKSQAATTPTESVK